MLVDVVVTDRQNRIVRGLDAEAFRLYEDGEIQSIDSVRFVEGGAGPQSPPGPESPAQREVPGSRPSPASPVGPADVSERCVVFLLDLSSTSLDGRTLLSRALARSLESEVQPGTRVAIFALKPGVTLLQAFTDDRERLLRSVSNLNTAVGSVAQADGGLLSPLAVEPFLKGAAEDASGYQLARLLDSIEIWQSQLREDPFTLRIIQSFLIMQGYTARRQTLGLLRAVQAIARGVAEVPGRKTLVLVSEGFIVGPATERELYETMEVANRSNLAIYGVEPQGLETHGTSSSLGQFGEISELNAETALIRKNAVGGDSIFDRAKVAGSDARESALQYLASAAGGWTIRNTNDLESGFGRIFREGGSYYLLAYRPRRSGYDGSLRTLKVDVDLPDSRIHHRQSYRAVPPGMEILSREQYQLLAAAAEGTLALDPPAEVDTYLFPSRSLLQGLLVSFRIPAAQLAYAPPAPTGAADGGSQTGIQTAKVELVFLVMDPETGTVVQSAGFPLNIHLTAEERNTLPHLTFSEEFRLVPGHYTVALLLADSLAGRARQFERTIRVPPPTGTVLVSDVVLGETVLKAEGGETLLTADGATVVPAPARTFAQGGG